jgi:hypothetical protein
MGANGDSSANASPNQPYYALLTQMSSASGNPHRPAARLSMLRLDFKASAQVLPADDIRQPLQLLSNEHISVRPLPDQQQQQRQEQPQPHVVAQIELKSDGSRRPVAFSAGAGTTVPVPEKEGQTASRRGILRETSSSTSTSMSMIVSPFALPRHVRQLIRVNATLLIFTIAYLVIWSINIAYRLLLFANNAKYAKSYESWTACAFAHFDGSASDKWKAVCGDVPADRLSFSFILAEYWMIGLYGLFMSFTYFLSIRKTRCFVYLLCCLEFLCFGKYEEEY